ncbi:MAG TPA: hypothetical protein H9672_01545 [Firmicutes bacterium]|nr:hypothetical protein [Bacillota bacterium]
MENKIEDKLIVKPLERGRGIVFLFVMVIVIVFFFYIVPEGFELFNTILNIFFLYNGLRAVITLEKIIILTPEGCTIKLFCYKKTYTWNQLKTKQWEDYRDFWKSIEGNYYQGGLFLSPYRTRQKYRKYPHEYIETFTVHPFASVYIYFKRPQDKVWKRSSDTKHYYEADEQVLRDTLSRWGVEIEEN